METILTLVDLEVGQSGIITHILIAGSMQRRLLDLGFIHGTPIRCLFKNPSGDPIAYFLRNTTIALRKEDASNILIKIV